MVAGTVAGAALGGYLGLQLGMKIGENKDLLGVLLVMGTTSAGLVLGGYAGFYGGLALGAVAGASGGALGAVAGGLGAAPVAGLLTGGVAAFREVKAHPEKYPTLIKNWHEAGKEKDEPKP